MKQLILVTVLCTACYGLSAQDLAWLTIATTGNTNLRITLNDRNYSQPDRAATFQNLQPGPYRLVIYQQQQQLQGGMAFTEVFSGTVQLKPGRHLELAVLRFGKVVSDETVIAVDPWSDGSYVNPPYAGGPGQAPYEPVKDADFVQLKAAVDAGYFDDDKLNNAKAVMKNNLFTANQVYQLCKLFSRDDNRMELARYAYDYCLDKGNYIIVKDAFYFNNAKAEFVQYLLTR